jgi:hypothetical protein
MAAKIEDLNMTLPHGLTLEGLSDLHGLNPCGIAAVKITDGLLQHLNRNFFHSFTAC